METVDVVIIGGGVVGAATLYALAASGYKKVMLLEKNRFASGSTGKSGGFIRVYHTDPWLSDLAGESFSTFLDYEAKMGQSCGYVQTGVLFFEPHDRVEIMQDEVKRLNQKFRYSIEVLTPEEGKAQFSDFDWQGIGGVVHEARAGYADPVRTTQGWIDRARELGTQACEGVFVENILTECGRIIGITSSLGRIACDVVILAAGAWSAPLLQGLGPQLPVRSKAIQIYFFQRPVSASVHPTFLDNTTDLYGRTERGGLSLIGYPVEAWDFDPDEVQPVDWSTAPKVQSIAGQRFPWVNQASVVGGRRGFDGYTPNYRGILEVSTDLKGLIIATGWSGGGFKLAPGIAQRIVRMIDGFQAGHIASLPGA